MDAADGHAGADTVGFAGALSGDTIRLLLGELKLRRELIIDGPGSNKLAVSGNDQSRIFHVTGGSVAIRGLTVKNGSETATANGPTCPNSSATGYTLGGGILQDAGLLNLEGVKVTNNEVSGPQNTIIGGGGIANIDGRLSMVRSQVVSGTVSGGAISGGGGILNCVGVVNLDRTKVRDSFVGMSSIAVGGGIANGLGSAHNTGVLTLNQSTIAMNDVSSDSIPAGGGLSTSGGPVKVMNSTINDNSVTATGAGVLADAGGAEIANATATFTNSTLADNTASAKFAAGGGILAGGTGEKLALHSVTLARNSADGTNSRGGNLVLSGSVRALNSIVAKGEATAGANCDGEVKSSKHDLEDKDTCGFDGEGDRVNKNPKLDPNLVNNGGPTDTLALKRGSPAIDHASKKTSPKRDQRGFKRVGKPDIGAYEFGAKP